MGEIRYYQSKLMQLSKNQQIKTQEKSIEIPRFCTAGPVGLGAIGGTGASIANDRLASRDIDTSIMGDKADRSTVVVTSGSDVECCCDAAAIDVTV